MFRRKNRVNKDKDVQNSEAQKKDVYVLNRAVTDVFILLKAYTYIIWYNGIVIDEDTYNALPEDCKQIFMKVPKQGE